MSPHDDQTDADEAGRPHPRRERAVVLFADPAGSIIRAEDAAPDDESLPVLTAFRQFLEAERRRARRQMAALIAVCLLALAGAAGGGAWYLRTVLNRVESAVEADKVKNEESRLAAISNLQGVARAALSLKQDVLVTRKTSEVLQDQVTAQTDELSKLLDTISTLEIQNSRIQRSMRRLNEQSAAVPAQPAMELRTEPEPPLPGPEARVSLAVPPPRPEPFERAERPLAPEPAPESMPVATEPAPAEPGISNPPAPSAVGITPGGVPYRLSLPRD